MCTVSRPAAFLSQLARCRRLVPCCPFLALHPASHQLDAAAMSRNPTHCSPLAPPCPETPSRTPPPTAHTRASCLPLQDPNEVVETPTMLHIMGQNNLLQRTGFRKDDTELEE